MLAAQGPKRLSPRMRPRGRDAERCRVGGDGDSRPAAALPASSLAPACPCRPRRSGGSGTREPRRPATGIPAAPGVELPESSPPRLLGDPVIAAPGSLPEYRCARRRRGIRRPRAGPSGSRRGASAAWLARPSRSMTSLPAQAPDLDVVQRVHDGTQREVVQELLPGMGALPGPHRRQRLGGLLARGTCPHRPRGCRSAPGAGCRSCRARSRSLPTPRGMAWGCAGNRYPGFLRDEHTRSRVNYANHFVDTANQLL